MGASLRLVVSDARLLHELFEARRWAAALLVQQEGVAEAAEAGE
jgi:hypothetical protein